MSSIRGSCDYKACFSDYNYIYNYLLFILVEIIDCILFIQLIIFCRSESITGAGLTRYAKVCGHNLLKVSLFGCSKLNDAGLESFFASNPRLLSVNVYVNVQFIFNVILYD